MTAKGHSWSLVHTFCSSERIIKIGQYLPKLCSNEKGSSFWLTVYIPEKAIQGKMVRYSRLRSHKVIEIGSKRMAVGDFPLDYHYNYVPIFYRFRDITIYSSKISVFAVLRTLLTHQTPQAIIVLHRIIRSWYAGRWWDGLLFWYSEEGPGRTAAPPLPLIAIPNVTAHPSTASVSITVLL